MGGTLPLLLLTIICLSGVSFGASEKPEYLLQTTETQSQHEQRRTQDFVKTQVPPDNIIVNYIYPANDRNYQSIRNVFMNSNVDASWMPIYANKYEIELSTTATISMIGIASDYANCPIRDWNVRYGSDSTVYSYFIPHQYTYNPIIQRLPIAASGIFTIRIYFDDECKDDSFRSVIEISLWTTDVDPPAVGPDMCKLGWLGAEPGQSEACDVAIPDASDGYCSCLWYDYHYNTLPPAGQTCTDLCTMSAPQPQSFPIEDPKTPRECRPPCATCAANFPSQCVTCLPGYVFDSANSLCTVPTDIYNLVNTRDLPDCGVGDGTPSNAKFDYIHPESFDMTNSSQGIVYFLLDWTDDPASVFRVKITTSNYYNNTNFYALYFSNDNTQAFYCVDETRCEPGAINIESDASNKNKAGRFWITLKDHVISYGNAVYGVGVPSTLDPLTPVQRFSFGDAVDFVTHNPHVYFCATTAMGRPPIRLLNARIGLPNIAIDVTPTLCIANENPEISDVTRRFEWLGHVTLPDSGSFYFKPTMDQGQSFTFIVASDNPLDNNNVQNPYLLVEWGSDSIVVIECHLNSNCDPGQTKSFTVDPTFGRWMALAGGNLWFGQGLDGEGTPSDATVVQFTLSSASNGYRYLALECSAQLPQVHFDYLISAGQTCDTSSPPWVEYADNSWACTPGNAIKAQCQAHCLFGAYEGSETRLCSYGQWSTLLCNKPPPCPALPAPDGGAFPCNAAPNYAICNQHCLFGVKSGSETRQCLLGKWTELVCNPMEHSGCEPLSAPKWGSGHCDGITPHNGTCIQACNITVVSGSTTRTCTDGVWSQLICKSPLPCPAIGPPLKGYGSCDVTPINGNCTQLCPYGVATGSTTRVCENGEWSPLVCLGKPCRPLGEPANGQGFCAQTPDGGVCYNQTCLVHIKQGNEYRTCTDGVWSPLVCDGTFVPVMIFEWTESILDRFDDVFAQPTPKLYPHYVFICRNTSIHIGHIWGNQNYTLDSKFCTAAAHVTGHRGGAFDVHFTMDVLLPPKRRSSYPSVGQNDILSTLWAGKYPITFSIDGLHNGPAVVNTPPSHHTFLLEVDDRTLMPGRKEHQMSTRVREMGAEPIAPSILVELQMVQLQKQESMVNSPLRRTPHARHTRRGIRRLQP